MRGPNDFKTERAHLLRENSTNVERRLWYRLRSRSINGHKFVRQEPIGPYVVDFVCRERRLIVELDGGQHAENPRDIIRDKWSLENLRTRSRSSSATPRSFRSRGPLSIQAASDSGHVGFKHVAAGSIQVHARRPFGRTMTSAPPVELRELETVVVRPIFGRLTSPKEPDHAQSYFILRFGGSVRRRPGDPRLKRR
jgi:hypothetical protein